MTCLNFAGTVARILLPTVSSCRRVIPSRKIALNSNGEVNYRELARRPWDKYAEQNDGSAICIHTPQSFEVTSNSRLVEVERSEKNRPLGHVNL